jgi:hypothetical protein
MLKGSFSASKARWFEDVVERLDFECQKVGFSWEGEGLRRQHWLRIETDAGVAARTLYNRLSARSYRKKATAIVDLCTRRKRPSTRCAAHAASCRSRNLTTQFVFSRVVGRGRRGCVIGASIGRVAGRFVGTWSAAEWVANRHCERLGETRECGIGQEVSEGRCQGRGGQRPRVLEVGAS